MRINLPATFGQGLKIEESGGSSGAFKDGFTYDKFRVKQVEDLKWKLKFNIINDPVVSEIGLLLVGNEQFFIGNERYFSFAFDRYTFTNNEGNIDFTISTDLATVILDFEGSLLEFVDSVIQRYREDSYINPTLSLGSNDVIKASNKPDLINLWTGDDKALGRGGKDRIFGGEGNDVLNGGGGNDKLFGDDGSDQLLGGAGRDVLDGGEGNDVLDGNKGRDTLTGGSGSDAFKFMKGSGKDKITDFQDDLDTILLDSRLWRGELSADEVAARYSSFVDGGILFDFGRHELFLEGVFNSQRLIDDIQFV